MSQKSWNNETINLNLQHIREFLGLDDHSKRQHQFHALALILKWGKIYNWNRGKIYHFFGYLKKCQIPYFWVIKSHKYPKVYPNKETVLQKN